MNEGNEYYIKSRARWRRLIGKLFCFLGLHRDYFSDKGGITTYNYCVRCGASKRMQF